MAIKLPSFKLLSATDTKSRVFLILASLTVVSVLIYFGIRILSSNTGAAGPSRVAAAPANLQSVPGSQIQGQYYRAMMQLNTQTAQQAQMTGGSAVPTLINVPGGGTQQSCTILCPNDENADVTNDINDLVKSGKLSQNDANKLLDLAKKNVSVDEYAAALDELVRQGKLTPEQARALLEKYKKQHENTLLKDSAASMDALIKSGQLPLDAANQLLALQKNKVSPADYAAELNQLVSEGKISPTTATQLLAQYAQQRAQEARKSSIFGLHQLAKTGAITNDVANDLSAMQSKNAPVDAYAAELQRLLAAGKITPEEAAKLLAQYKAQRAGMGGAALNELIRQLEIECKNDLAKQAKTGSAQPPLPTSCQKLNALKEEAQRLMQLQGNNASSADYANELKRAVEVGLITPETAAGLLQEYQAMTMAGALTIPGTEANLPTAGDFAKIQARIQQQSNQPVAAPAATAQFSAAASQADQQMEQDRLQRIQQMESAMSAQAQVLITAWQPPKMVHQAGAPPAVGKNGLPLASGSAGPGGAKGSLGANPLTETAPLIKTGTILFAVLDTAVDSDYPDTPVMATIVQGPFKGAKLLGKLALAQGTDKVSLNFNLMDRDDWIKTKTVSAFAIDPDTARTVLASSADYHYMMRYGSLFASSFLSGYASAIQSSGGTSTTGIFGTSSTNPAISPGNKIAVGLGQVGTALSSATSTYFNTPTTVKVNAGVGLGILFMADVPAT